ncbi:DUF998 domain-containing protein [Nonomuraea sp. CA-141351]|uniref:DUF998 domain-containing protein n=1 Tax=Nonomuraea sp. CA-141351 TaxID=3239996 RepID=UPI003D939C9D
MSTPEMTSAVATSSAARDARSPGRLGRMLAGTSLAWVACALATAVASELGRPGRVDMIGPTFSELIFTGLGARLVGITMLALAFASVCVVFALIDGRAPADRLSLTFIAAWTIGLVLAAIFPMTPVGAPPVWYDALHRYVALAGLVCLPLAGLRLARGFRADPGWQRLAAPVRVLSAASLVGVAAFLCTFIPVDDPVWLLGARQYSGITERVPLAANTLLLATLGAALRRRARPGPESMP